MGLPGMKVLCRQAAKRTLRGLAGKAPIAFTL